MDQIMRTSFSLHPSIILIQYEVGGENAIVGGENAIAIGTDPTAYGDTK